MAEVHTNARCSRSLVLKVLMDGVDERSVQDYVTTCMGMLYPVPKESVHNDMPCCVVGTSVNVSSTELADNNTFMVLAVYRAWGETANDIIENSIEDNFVITEEICNSNAHLMDPQIIGEFMRKNPPPDGVRIVGVSGVSELYGSKVWGEIISENRGWLGGEGGGVEVHPMSIYDEECEMVYYTQECSSLFQWLDN